ncbi:MAG TPA: hypothetical protein VIW29_09575 [Polyangiaceae bacterium]
MVRLGARFRGLVLGGLACSCSALIGLDDYEIEPSLDAQGGSAEPSAGGSAAGDGAQAGGNGGVPSKSDGGAAGDPGSAGEGGTAGVSGAVGAGGTGCDTSCDDDIECSVDSCVEGKCVHTPSSALCDADDDECVTCELGIGCVARLATVTQILSDPHFDLNSGDWSQDIRDNDAQDFIINPDPTAHSAANAAWWMPAPADAIGQAYADLIQVIELPLQTKVLRLSGVYELTAGVLAPSDDYATAGIFRGATELVEFHTWRGSAGAKASWTTFEYRAPPDQLASLLETLADDPDFGITFDIFGETWDSKFGFDTLSLEAVGCE